MAQTRARPKKKKTPVASANGAVAFGDVFNLVEAAAYLRVSEGEILQLVNDQALPGRQFGGQWRFLKSAIQDWLRTPPPPGSREAVLSTIGSMKDDPYLEEEVKEIYRKRREHLVGDDQ